MSFWNGTRWVQAEQTATKSTVRRANWAATLVTVIGLVALIVPFSSIAAASQKSDPGCSVSPALVGVNTSYTVTAWGLPTRGIINLPEARRVVQTLELLVLNPELLASLSRVGDEGISNGVEGNFLRVT